jgi:hypothetical protein
MADSLQHPVDPEVQALLAFVPVTRRRAAARAAREREARP